ncbi:MAG TPA: putative quinol monooxygenase [Candidatus Binatia bacterium]|nr:putative quinol monooxygenase [Candidatus Binatia bacterium]
MIVVQGWVRVHEGDRETLREAARTLVTETRKERGNLAYAFAEDFNDPGLFHIIERWADEEAVAGHMMTSHIAAFLPKLSALRDVKFKIARYDAPQERVLMEA